MYYHRQREHKLREAAMEYTCITLYGLFFLDEHSVPVKIDEIQKVPALIETIKIKIDEAKLKCVKGEKYA